MLFSNSISIWFASTVFQGCISPSLALPIELEAYISILI